MARYRKKLIEIEADQWFSISNGLGVNKLSTEWPFDLCNYCGRPYKNHGYIATLEGGHIVCPGDYIITGTEGEKYPCKPNIFKQTYEKIE